MSRILIVEDSPDNMKLFRTLLTLKGHEITALWNGEGLLETIAATDPGAGADGHPACPARTDSRLLAEIRQSAYARLRVVALTAHAMSG